MPSVKADLAIYGYVLGTFKSVGLIISNKLDFISMPLGTVFVNPVTIIEKRGTKVGRKCIHLSLPLALSPAYSNRNSYSRAMINDQSPDIFWPN